MILTKVLLVTVFVSGFVVVESFHVEEDVMQQDWEDGSNCGFCKFYFETGHGPYEVLWKLGSEIRPYVSLMSQILKLMDAERLKVAQSFFHNYCYKFCENRNKAFRRGMGEHYPCQEENGIIY